MESVEEWGALLAPPESRNGSWRRFLILENIFTQQHYLWGCQIRTLMLYVICYVKFTLFTL